MSFLQPISISLSPNTESKDTWLTFWLLFKPWVWKKGKAIEQLEQEFGQYIGVNHSISFNSGRSALFALLKSLGIQEGEVLLQAFTCNAVPNPVLWAGLTPVYVDCGEDYTMDSADLEKKITAQSRVVIVQHTFGKPADIETIQELCKKYNLFLIEDCAHALGATYKGKKVGSFGDAAFFSFSRDKVISCVYGGMVTTNNIQIAEKVRVFQKEIGYPSFFWIKQQLSHPVFMNMLILPTYRVVGKYVLVLFQWLHIFSKAVHWKEKQGKKPAYFPKALPNALAQLALLQFAKVERFNSHRKELAEFYTKELAHTDYKLQDASYEKESIFLRFPVRHRNAHKIIQKARKQNILLGDWYTTPIAPFDTKAELLGYQAGSCPVAEKLSQETLNLPTHIRFSIKDAEKVIEFLKSQ